MGDGTKDEGDGSALLQNATTAEGDGCALLHATTDEDKEREQLKVEEVVNR